MQKQIISIVNFILIINIHINTRYDLVKLLQLAFASQLDNKLTENAVNDKAYLSS